MNQNFRKIPELKYLYEVNEDGIVRNVKSKNILKPRINQNGYLQINFHIKDEPVTRTIHKLVADAFLKDTGRNPDGTEYRGIRTINHKDENKLNNNYKNLEYCDIYYNNAYGTRLERSAQTRTHVIVMDNEIEFENSEKAAEYIISIPEFSEHNLRTVRNHIRSVCAGSRKTAYKHKWYYKDSVN